MPRRLGIAGALSLSSACHALSFASLLAFWRLGGLGWGTLGATLLIGGLLVWQHRLARPDDLSRINMAFFTLNGLVSFAFLAGVGWDMLI